MRNFNFRRLQSSHLDQVRRWLQEPHLRSWWPDADLRIDEMRENLENPDITMMLVSLSDHAFAYIHDHDARYLGLSQFSDLPPRSRVVSTFVGDVGFMGQGHSSAYIDTRVRQLRRDYPLVAVGPNTKDTHAIQVYVQAGFRKRALRPARDGNLIQVMTHL